MIIHLPSPNPFKSGPLYIGAQRRFDTLTDVCFYGEDMFITVDRQSALMYLVRYNFDEGTHSILTTLSLIWRDRPVLIEMIEVKGDLIFGVSYSHQVWIVQIYKGDDGGYLLRMLEPAATKPGYLFHSITRYTDTEFVLAEMNGHLTIFNASTRRFTHHPLPGLRYLRNKEILPVGDGDRFLVFSASSGPKPVPSTYNGSISLYKKRGDGLSLLDVYYFRDTHFDGGGIHKGIYYVTAVEGAQSALWRMRVVGSKIQFIDRVPTLPFPHGVSVKEDRIAYASYGASSVCIFDVLELDNTTNIS